MRAVVHRLHRQRQLSCLETLEQQRRHLTHCQHWSKSSRQVGIVKTVTLLGYGECNHLQRRLAENLHQSCPVAELIVSLQALGDRCNHLLFDGSRRLQADEQREIVVRLVCLVYYLIVEGLGNDDAAVILACVQRVVDNCGRECTEDVATSKMHPCRLVVSALAHSGDVKLRKLIAFGFPLGNIGVA